MITRVANIPYDSISVIMFGALNIRIFKTEKNESSRTTLGDKIFYDLNVVLTRIEKEILNTCIVCTVLIYSIIKYHVMGSLYKYLPIFSGWNSNSSK